MTFNVTAFNTLILNRARVKRNKGREHKNKENKEREHKNKENKGRQTTTERQKLPRPPQGKVRSCGVSKAMRPECLTAFIYSFIEIVFWGSRAPAKTYLTKLRHTHVQA